MGQKSTQRLVTRHVETKDLLRASVISASVLAREERTLVLKTHAVRALRPRINSADQDMLNQRERARQGEPVEGRLRIDVVSDHVLRVRYAEGTAVPENPTPMLVGTPPAPARCIIHPPAPATAIYFTGNRIPGQMVRIETAALDARIMLDPYRIEVRDRAGRLLCGAGGPEKDFFCFWDSLNTGVCRAGPEDHPIAVENFDLRPDEAIYGFGERFIKLNKVGQTFDINMDDTLGVTTPRAYKNIPFYVSTHGYGVFFNHSCAMTAWVGSLSSADVQIALDDDFLDYFILTGSIKDVLARYTDLTGKGVLPPKWSFGYWQSKISYSSAAETLEIARKLRENQVPCDVIHLDTFWFQTNWFCDLQFAPDRFPDPAAYLHQLAKMGFKVSLWQLPYIPEGSQFFADLAAVDGFVKNDRGEIYSVDICFVAGFKGRVGVIDFSNPAAVRVYQDYLRRLFKLGARVVKTDFGEAAPADGVYHDGTPGRQMHNLYPLLYNQAAFEVTREATGDGLVWARSAWAGNQRYPLHWGGDNSPNWFNMIPQIEGGLSFGLSGFQFWSQDIGGFLGGTNDRLLIRWLQMGMFLSHSRIHGDGDRELYKFEPETLRICREFVQLRYRLMPYLYGAARACVEQSLPMARALVVDYQDDPNTWNLGDEFLLGAELLVAPIFDDGIRRSVYLPAGVWTDWWTGRRIPGGCWIQVEAELDRIPLFIREGGLVPMGPVMNFVDEKPTDELEIRVAAFEQDGHTEFTASVGSDWVRLAYDATAGHHRIVIGPTPARVTVRRLDGGPIEIIRN